MPRKGTYEIAVEKFLQAWGQQIQGGNATAVISKAAVPSVGLEAVDRSGTLEIRRGLHGGR